MRQVLRAGALGWPGGMGWGGRWKGGSRWGTHVNPWLIHVNVWQKPLQYCKVISLQLMKWKKKKKVCFNFSHTLRSVFFFAFSERPDFSSLFVVVQLLSCVRLFATPRTAAYQASLFFTISWGLFRLMSIELMMPSSHPSSVVPFSSCLQSFSASGSFPGSWLFTSGGQSIGASASASVLPMNIQGWFPLGWTGWISLQSRGLSRVFCSTEVQKHQPWPNLVSPGCF